MKRCKHKHVEARIWSRYFNDWRVVPIPVLTLCAYDALICRDCGEWLGLGESDETPERIAVEVRAAEIAVDAETRAVRKHSSPGEMAGWYMAVNAPDRAPLNDGEWSGYLAAEIFYYSEPQ